MERSWIRQSLAVIAAAIVLAYVGTTAVSQVRGFAPWQGNLAWLVIAAMICGILIAFTNDDAIWLMIAATVLSVLIFIGLWSVIFWVLLGRALPLHRLILSDFLFIYFVQRGSLILFLGGLFGLLGVASVMILQIFIPERYRP